MMISWSGDISCPPFGVEHASPTSAADLKFLHRLRHTHFRNFKSKSGTRIIYLLVPLLLPKFVSEVPQCITNFGSGAPVPKPQCRSGGPECQGNGPILLNTTLARR